MFLVSNGKYRNTSTFLVDLCQLYQIAWDSEKGKALRLETNFKLKEQHWNKTWKVCGWILMNPVIAMLLAGQVDSDLFSSYGSNHHFLRLFFRHRKHANSPAVGNIKSSTSESYFFLEKADTFITWKPLGIIFSEKHSQILLACSSSAVTWRLLRLTPRIIKFKSH